MRVLFTVNPEKSTFLYVVPLAWSLRTAGHQVYVASQPSFAATITQAGLSAVPIGYDADKWSSVREKPDLLEAARAGLPQPWDAVTVPGSATWNALVEGHIEAVNEIHNPDNAPLIDGLVEFARYWQPDLIVWEPYCYAGPIAAKASGAAHVRILFGADVFGRTRELFLQRKAEQPVQAQRDPLADWLAGHANRYGFEFTEDMTTGQGTVDQLPRSLQLEGDLNYLRMQYIPYGGAATIPNWLQQPPQRPRVALTMGLTATEIFNGYNIPISEAVTTLANLDLEVIATLAESEQTKVIPVPENVRLVSYVPWHVLAQTCSAVIHHGGAATLATASRYGIPQLCLHYHFDQPILGRKLAEQGSGLEIHTTEATGENIRDGVARLLNEPAFKERAQRLRAEILSQPSPNQLIPQLTALAKSYQTR